MPNKVLKAGGNVPGFFAISAAAEPDWRDIQAEGEAADKPKLRGFTMLAYTGGAMGVGGFYRPVVVDLAGVKVANSKTPILRGHDPDQIVGHGKVTISAKDITVDGVISAENSHSQEVVSSSRNGFPWQASIGASVREYEVLGEKDTATVNGQAIKGPCLIARKSVLSEVSFVPMGADSKTSAKVAASAAGDHKMNDFEKWLQAKKIDQATLAPEVEAVLKAQFNAEVEAAKKVAKPEDNGEDEELEKARKIRAEESRRIDGIVKACKGKHGTIEAEAIEKGWTVKEAETQVELADLRAGRAAPTNHGGGGSGGGLTLQAMQGAMVLRAGGRLDHPVYNTPQAVAIGIPSWLRAGINTDQRQQIMETAHLLASMSMIDMAREACHLDGREAPRDRDTMLRAAFSGSALSNIFTTSVNAMLIEGFNEAGDTTEAWTRTEDVADFKSNDRIRLQKGPNLTKLPRGSEADHSSRSDQVESYKIARYAKQFVVDEQDMIDDMFNALSDIPREHGRAAARLRPDLVYSVLMSNPTLAATAAALFVNGGTQDNLDTTSALAITTLKAAVSSMFLKTENGVNLNIKPTHLIVPPTLIYTARELLNSTMINIARGGGTDLTVERGNYNALLNDQLQIVADSRLENGVTSPDSGTTYAGSPSTWYLASNTVPTLVVGYLRGTGRAPRVRSWNLSEGKYGMGWDISMDIGAKAMEWRGLHKVTA